jgi:YfiR/HmsC-like
VVVAAVLCLCALARPFAQTAVPAPTPAIEDTVKAVFLYNFAKYVSWPSAVVGDRSPAEVRICVTADDAFYALLKDAVEGESIDGKPLLPVALEGLDDARTCHILYVGDTQTLDAKAWLGAVRNRQVLTVGDGPLTDEIVITFVRDQNRLRFDVNRTDGTRRGLNISSKLLRLARQVRER